MLRLGGQKQQLILYIRNGEAIEEIPLNTAFLFPRWQGWNELVEIWISSLVMGAADAVPGVSGGTVAT